MAHVDIDPFSKYDKMKEHPDEDKTIPFTPGGVIEGGSTWKPVQETSFEGKTQRSTG